MGARLCVSFLHARLKRTKTCCLNEFCVLFTFRNVNNDIHSNWLNVNYSKDLNYGFRILDPGSRVIMHICTMTYQYPESSCIYARWLTRVLNHHAYMHELIIVAESTMLIFTVFAFDFSLVSAQHSTRWSVTETLAIYAVINFCPVPLGVPQFLGPQRSYFLRMANRGLVFL